MAIKTVHVCALMLLPGQQKGDLACKNEWKCSSS